MGWLIEISADDQELLGRAGAWEHCPTLQDCSPLKLSEIARSHGLDFATALLYNRVLRHPAHGAFFRRVRNGEAPRAVEPRLVGPPLFIVSTKTRARTGRGWPPLSSQ